MAQHQAERSIPWQDHIILFLLMLCTIHLVSSTSHKDCPCNGFSKYRNTPDMFEVVEAGSSRQLQCCVFGALGFNDPNASVEWTFNGKPLPGDKSNNLYCNNETLHLTGVEETDKGTYTCTVTSTNGTSRLLNLNLCLCTGTDGYREKPKDVQVSKTCAKEGGTAELTCEAMVGLPGCTGEQGSIRWWLYKPNGKPGPLPKGAKMADSDRRAEWKGILRKSLVMKSVTKEHFGNYVCIIKNDYDSIKGITTLMEGDPDYCGKSKLALLATECAAAATVVALCMVFCWWRFRRNVAVALMMRKKKKEQATTSPSSDGFLNDVFIIHGPTACSWIYDVLLPNLEEYGYSCFVPVRDMYGGELYADAICNNMRQCRRLLVVKTPCLLQSQWSSWTAQQGMKTWMTSPSSHILAIVLQEFGSDAVSLETAGLLKTLEAVKETIKVPKAWRMQDMNNVSTPIDIYAENLLEKGKKEPGRASLKLSIPVCSGFPLPENTLLSNMITGSNHASRENLEEVKDIMVKDGEEARGLPVIYIENEVGIMEDDLGSPCSNSPFILPSNMQKDSPHCSALLKCLKDVFVGDPEVVFWQKLRLFLEPPAQGRKRNLTVQSTA